MRTVGIRLLGYTPSRLHTGEYLRIICADEPGDVIMNNPFALSFEVSAHPTGEFGHRSTGVRQLLLSLAASNLR